MTKTEIAQLVVIAQPLRSFSEIGRWPVGDDTPENEIVAKRCAIKKRQELGNGYRVCVYSLGENEPGRGFIFQAYAANKLSTLDRSII